jgi:hypothetical protein
MFWGRSLKKPHECDQSTWSDQQSGLSVGGTKQFHKPPAPDSRGPTASRSQATTVIGKVYRFAIANGLAERLNTTCRRRSRAAVT